MSVRESFESTEMYVVHLEGQVAAWRAMFETLSVPVRSEVYRAIREVLQERDMSISASVSEAMSKAIATLKGAATELRSDVVGRRKRNGRKTKKKASR